MYRSFQEPLVAPVAIMRKLEPRILEDDEPRVLLRGFLELLPHEVQQGRRGREGEVGVLRFRVNCRDWLLPGLVDAMMEGVRVRKNPLEAIKQGLSRFWLDPIRLE